MNRKSVLECSFLNRKALKWRRNRFNQPVDTRLWEFLSGAADTYD